jgi:hypothetical protein
MKKSKTTIDSITRYDSSRIQKKDWVWLSSACVLIRARFGLFPERIESCVSSTMCVEPLLNTTTRTTTMTHPLTFDHQNHDNRASVRGLNNPPAASCPWLLGVVGRRLPAHLRRQRAAIRSTTAGTHTPTRQDKNMPAPIQARRSLLLFLGILMASASVAAFLAPLSAARRLVAVGPSSSRRG